MAAPSASRSGFVPVEAPQVSVAADGTLAAVHEAARVTILALPSGAAFAQIGVDPDATASEIVWVGTPGRLIVLARYEAHSTVHLLDPHGPRTIAEIRLEQPMRLLASVGATALVVGSLGAAVLAATETHLTLYPFPTRAVPLAAGPAATQIMVALPGSIEEWDPRSRLPKRRLRLPRVAAITAVGGSERLVWMTTRDEPARVDVIPLINRGQPRAHDLPEPIARTAAHPRSDLLVCVGAESGKLYVLDLDGRAPGYVTEADGLERIESAALVVGRSASVVVAQARRPIAIVTLARRDPAASVVPQAGPDAPSSPRDDALAATPEELPTAAAAREELLAAAREALPADVSEELPAAAAAREELLAAAREALPADVSEQLPAGAREELPAAASEELPAAASEEVPAAASEELPAAVREELPDDAREALPAEVSGEPPDDARDELPDDAPEELPDDAREALPADAPEALPIAVSGPATLPVVRSLSLHEPTAPIRSISLSDELAPWATAAAGLGAGAAASLGALRIDGLSGLDDAAAHEDAEDAAPIAPERDDALSWRDEVVAWTRAGALAGEAPAAAGIAALAARFELAPRLERVLVRLYGAHLCGEHGVAPVEVAHVLDRRWDEALGRGELAQHGLAIYAASRVALAPAVQRVLDELPPTTGTLVGAPGTVALLGACVVVAGDEPLAAIAARCLDRVGGAVLAAHAEADPAALAFEARVYGAAPMRRAASVDRTSREPLIVVVGDAQLADDLGVPRLA